MKVLSLVLAILCLSLSVSAQQTSGPVVNADSVLVEADDDADNDGKFTVKTKHIERLTVDNDGKVSIGAGGGPAIININTLPSNRSRRCSQYANSRRRYGNRCTLRVQVQQCTATVRERSAPR